MKIISSISNNILRLFISPLFLYLTLIGNTIIISFAVVFWQIETPANSKLVSFIDALWWSFATATTVGYGDITPVTTSGKVLGILLMLTGTAIFASYTALFAEAILGFEFLKLRLIETNTDHIIKEMQKSLDNMNEKLDAIEKRMK
ncbi:MAG: two pore domain potassium channel family protein [Proteobacteria bacterium]|nr:two pore domain potassium channel family protein [Pseudomonadota bacterium]